MLLIKRYTVVRVIYFINTNTNIGAGDPYIPILGIRGQVSVNNADTQKLQNVIP